MVIDVHQHLVGSGWVRGKFIRSTSKAMASRYNIIHGTKYDNSEYLTKVARTYLDPDADELV